MPYGEPETFDQAVQQTFEWTRYALLYHENLHKLRDEIVQAYEDNFNVDIKATKHVRNVLENIMWHTGAKTVGIPRRAWTIAIRLQARNAYMSRESNARIDLPKVLREKRLYGETCEVADGTNEAAKTIRALGDPRTVKKIAFNSMYGKPTPQQYSPYERTDTPDVKKLPFDIGELFNAAGGIVVKVDLRDVIPESFPDSSGGATYRKARP